MILVTVEWYNEFRKGERFNSGGVKMVVTKNDVISFVNNSSAAELRAFCEFINDYQERKKAEAEFFKQMNIAEESISTEGTITSAELRASLGI